MSTVRPDLAANAASTWADLERTAPDLAERIEARFAANLHHVLGTLRPDGAPRLSGTEVRIADGEVSLGMMPDSRKLADVRRDPRVELHSAPLEEDLAGGDAKLAGVLVEVAADDADAGRPQGAFFRLALGIASLVRVEADQLVVSVWHHERGLRELRRT